MAVPCCPKSLQSVPSFPVKHFGRHILTKVMAYEEMKKQRAHVSKKKLRASNLGQALAGVFHLRD